MKKNIRYWMQLLCLFVISSLININNVCAQQISLTTLSLDNQLPSQSVQRIFQDREGFMWLGTKEGLCRYDSYRTLVYRSGLKTPNLLTDNEITSIAEDRRGRLLVGTKKGINLIDKRTYQITHVENNELKDQEIRSMLVDTKGRIWIGTLTSVFRCSSDFSSCKRYDSSLPVTSVNSINEDTDGNIWVTLWRNGLHRYNSHKDSFIKYPKIGEMNNPFRIFQDDKKQHWVCTWGNGVYLFYPDEKEGAMYFPVEFENDKDLSKHGTFFSITQDERFGYIWLVSNTGLQVIQKRAGNKVSNVDISHISTRLNNIFSEIVKDKKGNLWIAAFNEGVFVVNFDKPLVRNIAIPSIRRQTGVVTNIRAVYKDKEGDFWINQNRWGLGIYSPQKKNVLFYQDISVLKNLAGMNNIGCIIENTSTNGEIWITPSYGHAIYGVRKEKGKITLSTLIDLNKVTDNPGNPVSFFEDSKLNLWILTTTKLLVKPARQSKIRDTGFKLGGMTDITEGKDGAYWISCRKEGVYRLFIGNDFKAKESQISHYCALNDHLMSDNINSICVGTNGEIWMGSLEGHVFFYDPEKNIVEDLSSDFSALEESVLNIITDKNGHIWISTGKRIIEYNPKNGGKIEYSVDDDILVNSFVQNSNFVDTTGLIYYGGNRGISAFTSYEKLSKQPDKIKTYVVDVKLNGESVLQKENNQCFDLKAQYISLVSNDKNIEIDFSSLNYTFPSKVRYAYKMEGVDDDWVYVKDNRQFAIYNKLPKGKRSFLLKATDINGLWSNRISKITVYKSPAFYETWWAYIIYSLLFVLFVYFSYRRMKNRIQLRHELRIAQIEKEKSEELTQTKLRYFTNISHDLLTPLTIITCLIDDAEITFKDKIPQFELIRANVNRLKRLLQQILDFRKMESGNMKLKISHGDIVPFINDVCVLNFAPLMKKKGLNFSFVPSTKQLLAYFDIDKVDKVVFNLLSNACKHTEKGGNITVELNTFFLDNHTYLSISVSDTGEGIAQTDLKNIFTRFYTNSKGDASETNGIGLSLTKDLLELHHGTIRVESELGKGSTFIVEIPIDKDSYNESEYNLLESALSSHREKSKIEVIDIDEQMIVGDNESERIIEDIQILVVEDNEELLFLMERILSRCYHVIIAKDGVQALSLMQNNDIDIIVSDVMMPEMDGLELCRTIKSDLSTSHIPVILLTAKNSVEDRIECYNAGADGYISKPFELKVLEARINNFIANKKDKQKEFRSDVDINLETLEASSIDREFLDKLVGVIQSKMSEPNFDVVQLADTLAVSKSSLYRKMKVMTGLSPVEFIRNIRLKHASQLLKNKSITVSEVAYSCGFSNPKYFATCFKEEFGMTPKEYQRRKND